MFWLLLFLIFVFGLCLGSFLNVCIYRLPRDESVADGRSYCPHCGQQIDWYDNIPLISFMILAGKCRHCGEAIRSRYFLVELASGLAVAASGYIWLLKAQPDYFNFILSIIFVLISLAMAAIDLEFSIIPNELNYALIVVGLVSGLFTRYPFSSGLGGQFQPRQIWTVLFGFFLGGGIFLFLALISPLIYGKSALGMGDVKLIAAYGAWLGPGGVLLTIISGSLIGAIVGTVLMKLKGRSLREEIPFGPFLCLAGVISYLYGTEIIHWYLSLMTRGV
ncbi:MAG: prepilin peptidase [bacterium]